MRNVLVTGGAGFIGSALVRGLLDETSVEKVVVIDSLLTGAEANLTDILDRIEFHRVDIRDRSAIGPLFDGIDVVFHEAAIPSVPRSMDEPGLTHDVNVTGTLNVLLAAQRSRVKRVVYAGSSSVYGDTVALPKVETMPPNPRSPYAVQKLVGESYCKTFFENYGLETVSLRYFNVFGPRQDPSSPYSGVLSLFCTAALERRPPTIFGDGEQTRDFTFVDNIVRLNVLAARAPDAAGKIYNGGTGTRTSLNDVWRTVLDIEGIKLDANYGPPRPGDVRDSQADLTAARGDLGYEPAVDLEAGLQRTMEWYRSIGTSVRTNEAVG